MDEMHRRTMRRFEEVGHARFLTFSCYRRLPLLRNDAIKDVLVERLRMVLEAQHVLLLAWVIMPEHVHLIVFPKASPDLQRFTHALKRPFAEAVLRRWKELHAPILEKLHIAGGYRFWQSGGGYDRNLYESNAMEEKINYIHNNSVERGLCGSATDYAWSSARWYAGAISTKLNCDVAT